MKYKVINSDIFLNKKIIPENSEVELTKEQTKGIEDFLELIETTSSKASAKEEKKKSNIKSSDLSTIVSTKVEALAKEGKE
jgi:hypothetical protein